MDVMKRCLVILAVLLVAWPVWAPASAADLGEGIDAYRRGDGAAALAVFEPLAEQGDRNAQFMMGVLHEDGVGIAKDMAKAIAWFRRAAEAGLASAQYNLAQYYENGTGVAADPSMAVGWYRRAAARGHGKAQNNLGLFYAAGKGVAKDLVEAWMWYELASRHLPGKGHRVAVENRDRVEKAMSPAQVAEARNRAATWKPKK